MARSKKPTLYQRLAAAKVAKDAAVAQYDELVSEARDALTRGTHREANVVVKVQPNRTWNKDKALENFGDDICTMQVDLAKARQFLTGDEFDSLYVEGPNKIIVQVLDND